MATVTFDTQGGSSVVSQTVTIGQLATIPTAPTYADYVLDGWFTEYTCVNEWDFATDTVPGDMSLYAKWNYQIITPTEVKTLLQISGTSKDALIGMMIPIIQDDLITYCRNTFEVDGVVVWPSGITIVAARMIGEQMAETAGGGASIGLDSETQGGYSYTRQSGTNSKGLSGYSMRTEAMMNKWKLVGAQFAQKMQAFRDRRGIPLDDLAEGKAIHGQEGVPLGSAVYPRRWVAE